MVNKQLFQGVRSLYPTSMAYESEIEYTCDEGKQFMLPDKEQTTEMIKIKCQWDSQWENQGILDNATCVCKKKKTIFKIIVMNSYYNK